MVNETDVAARSLTDPSQSRRRILIALLVTLVIVAAIICRLSLASMAQHPGRADFSYYYTVAENIASDRGFEIDYIWHYLSKPTNITHYTNDYWMPMTAVLISGSMQLLGTSMFTALLPSVIAGLLLIAVTWAIGRLYKVSTFVQIGAACLIAFFPPLFRNSLLTDSTVFYALFASVSICLMIQSRTNPRWLIAAAGAAALAHLTRQDGVFLLVILLVTGIRNRLPVTRKIGYLAVAFSLYGVIMAPLCIINIQELGVLLPSGSSKAMFLTTYEDIYSFSRDLSLSTYIKWGWSNIIRSKTAMTRLGGVIMYKTLGPVLTILVVIGSVKHWLRKRSDKDQPPVFQPVAMGVLLLGFYVLVATFPGSQGGFQRSLLAVSPFLIIWAIHTLESLLPSRGLAIMSLAVLITFFAVQSVQASLGFMKSNAQLHEQLNRIEQIVRYDAATRGIDQDIVIMTRNPWQVYHSTRFKAIQIPNDDLETIYRVGKQYGANYIILPAPRTALDPIARGTVHDPRFQWIPVNTGSWMQLFRVE